MNLQPNLAELERRIGVEFKNKELLQHALIHRSFLNEYQGAPITSNEKMEFLGDSVLSLITSQYLFKHYPQYNEGIYTDIKAAIVRTESLYAAADGLGVGEFLLLSKGEEEHGGRQQKSILADCFEAIIAAIFLEAGFETARIFVEKHLFENKLDEIIQSKDYLPAKNILQEYYQGKHKILPSYVVTAEAGPQHNKEYEISVYAHSKIIATGQGKSKKEAEENAARNALEALGI